MSLQTVSVLVTQCFPTESEDPQPTVSLTLPESELRLLLPTGSAEENKPLHITVRLPS